LGKGGDSPGVAIQNKPVNVGFPSPEDASRGTVRKSKEKKKTECNIILQFTTYWEKETTIVWWRGEKKKA